MSGILQTVFQNFATFSSNWIGLLTNASNSFGNAVAIDSSGNVFIFGYANPSGSNDFLLAKYNNSGVIQWQKSLGSAWADEGYAIAVDASGVYISGENGAGNFQLAKYDTSGAIQWQRELAGGGSTEQAKAIALDSSSNVYFCGSSDTSGSNDIQVVKYNSSGTIQWQRRLGGANNDRGFGIAIDSSSNVYACGFSTDSGSLDIQLAKYNSSGTIQWQRRLGSGSSSSLGLALATDSSDNLYVCGYNNASGNNGVQLAKYNSSGTIQWQRVITQSAKDISGYGITIKDSNLYINGYGAPLTTTTCYLFAKLPTDGSLTGTYTVGGVTLVYAASSLTDASTSLATATSTLTSSTSTLVDAAGTLTDATPTLTSSVTTI